MRGQIEAAAVEVDVLLTIPDLRRAISTVMFRRPAVWVIIAMGAIMLFLGIANYLITHTWFTGFFAIALFCLAYVALMPGIRARDPGNRSPDENLTVHYRIDSIKVSRTSSISSLDLTWKAFFGMRETKDAFLLFTNKLCFFVIPKRCLATAPEIAQLRGLMLENFPATQPNR